MDRNHHMLRTSVSELWDFFFFHFSSQIRIIKEVTVWEETKSLKKTMKYFSVAVRRKDPPQWRKCEDVTKHDVRGRRGSVRFLVEPIYWLHFPFFVDNFSFFSKDHSWSHLNVKRQTQSFPFYYWTTPTQFSSDIPKEWCVIYQITEARRSTSQYQ